MNKQQNEIMAFIKMAVSMGEMKYARELALSIADATNKKTILTSKFISI